MWFGDQSVRSPPFRNTSFNKKPLEPIPTPPLLPGLRHRNANAAAVTEAAKSASPQHHRKSGWAKKESKPWWDWSEDDGTQLQQLSNPSNAGGGGGGGGRKPPQPPKRLPRLKGKAKIKQERDGLEIGGIKVADTPSAKQQILVSMTIAPQPPAFTIGQHVEALWKGQGQWYPAIVQSFQKQADPRGYLYSLEYVDGDRDDYVEQAHIRNPDLQAIGSKGPKDASTSHSHQDHMLSPQQQQRLSKQSWEQKQHQWQQQQEKRQQQHRPPSLRPQFRPGQCVEARFEGGVFLAARVLEHEPHEDVYLVQFTSHEPAIERGPQCVHAEDVRHDAVVARRQARRGEHQSYGDMEHAETSSMQSLSPKRLGGGGGGGGGGGLEAAVEKERQRRAQQGNLGNRSPKRTSLNGQPDSPQRSHGDPLSPIRRQPQPPNSTRGSGGGRNRHGRRHGNGGFHRQHQSFEDGERSHAPRILVHAPTVPNSESEVIRDVEEGSPLHGGSVAKVIADRDARQLRRRILQNEF